MTGHVAHTVSSYTKDDPFAGESNCKKNATRSWKGMRASHAGTALCVSFPLHGQAAAREATVCNGVHAMRRAKPAAPV